MWVRATVITPRIGTALRLFLPVLIAISTGGIRSTHAQTVQAVMFFSPTCRHCHQVITQYLPVLFRNNGGLPGVVSDESVPQNERSLILFRNSRLEILLIDASKRLGSELYQASTRNQLIPPERSGVPRLVIGDDYLVGSIEISERTGDLVRQGFERGGLGWPAVDGLREAVAVLPGLAPVVAAETRDSVVTEPEQPAARDTAPTTPPVGEQVDTISPNREAPVVEEPAEVLAPASPDEVATDSMYEEATDSESTAVAEPVDSVTTGRSAFDMVPMRELSMVENFQLDPVGNGFSVVVLLLMSASVVAVWFKPDLLPKEWGLGALVPLLALVGAGVAGYLTYIEATGVTAVCGPVGDCNTVNQSEYARLFGLIPVGALGLLGYVAIASAWVASKFAPETAALWARVSLLAMVVGGTLFSIYLTFLEPFVIGATCAWCLTSSIIMTALMWLFASEGRYAWTRIRSGAS